MILINDFINKLVKLNDDTDLDARFEEIIELSNKHNNIANNNNIPMGPGVAGGSPCLRDLYFWYLFARTLKPKMVLEIGAWIGTSTLVIAKALNEIYGDDFKIVTCDFPNDVFIREHNYKYLSKNIYYNNLHSDQLVPELKEQGYKFDAIFSDAGLSLNNVNDFKSLINNDSFCFLTHDVYTSKYSKGNDAIDKINLSFDNLNVIVPKHEDGYKVEGIEHLINAVSGAIISEKLYENTF